MRFGISLRSLFGELEDQGGLITRLRRQRNVFGGTFLAVLLLTAVAYVFLPRSYQATASIILSTPDQILGATSSIEAINEQKKGDPADLESQILVLKSQTTEVAKRQDIRDRLRAECEALRTLTTALRELLTNSTSKCANLNTDERAAEDLLRANVSVDGSGRARVIEITYASPLPEVAQAIPNAYASMYISNARLDKLQPRASALQWLKTETNRVSVQLTDLESSIERFRRDRGLAKGQNAPIAAEQLTAIGERLAAAEAQRAEAVSKLRQLHGGDNDAEVHDVIATETIASLRAKLSGINAQIAEMSSVHGAAYPDLMGLLHQKDAVTSDLKVETSRVANSLGHDASAAEENFRNLQTRFDTAKQQVQLGTGAETSIASLERNADILRDLYVDLTKKMNEIETESRMLEPDTRLLNYAELPNAVSFPRRIPFALTGLALALGFGVGAALLRDRADSTVRAGSSVQASAGVPVVGYLPWSLDPANGSEAVSIRDRGQPSAIEESLRALYAQVILVPNAGPRMLMVTSSQAGDGKSFVTLALGQFAANAGRRVLAIECDLRRPTFCKTLKLKGGPSLTEALRAQNAGEKLFTPSGISGLDVVTAGSPAMDSTELLSTSDMKSFLALARDRYDLVLIDCPPALGLADAALISRWVDGTLYCASWGTSRIGLVAEGVESIQRAGGNILGVVLNKIDAAKYSLYESSGAVSAYITSNV